jgi:hypothetical protein
MEWITKEGKKIKVSDMSDSHLINTIDMVKRKLAEDPRVYSYIGDSMPAEQAVESENRINDGIRENLNKALGELNKERQKRLSKLDNK